MTHTFAIHVLIEAASRHAAGRYCIGTSRSIRSLPSDAEKCRIAEAVAKVYPKAYGREASDQDLWRLGLDRYQSQRNDELKQ